MELLDAYEHTQVLNPKKRRKYVTPHHPNRHFGTKHSHVYA